MCGICGIYNFKNNRPADAITLKNMAEALKYRGPDAEGFYIDKEVGLGHRRLSIIDLNTGSQPMSNEDGSVVVVFNGEIYNYPQLRRKLQTMGHVLRSTSDTEVIIHLYEDRQEDCLDELNGIFAFCIWDAKNKKMILARDRLGVKPVFYSFTDEGILFASEVKSLLQYKSLDRQIDDYALDDYFSLGYITGGKTIFKKVRSLAPATILSVSKESCRYRQYWDITYSDILRMPSNCYCDTLISQLEKSIGSQMVSDVPVGAFLSGGLDSSCVVSFMSAVSSEKIRTFSIGFSQESYNELLYARMVSQFFATQHNDLTVNPDIKNILPKLVWFYDEPFSDTSAIPMYFLSKLAASSLKVVLSGDGGDEVFCGYPTYIADRLAGYYAGLPKLLKNTASVVVNMLPVSFDKVSFDYKAKRFVAGADYQPLMAHYFWRLIYSDAEKNNLYSDDFRNCLMNYSPYTVFEGFYNKPKEATVFQRLSYVDFKTWLVDDILRKVDRASMANSLEARVPLLDHELVEFGAAIPENLKLKGLQTKYLFKKAVKGRIPKGIVFRKKSGFNAPVSHWIENELRSFVLDYLNTARLKRLRYFQDNFVTKMLNEHFSHKKDNGLKIWNLLNFMLWHEIFVEGAA